jgi:hypothetical protein
MITEVFLHASKESMYNQGHAMGLKGEALNNFMYACYEVKLKLEVDEETGEAKIIGVDGSHNCCFCYD